MDLMSLMVRIGADTSEADKALQGISEQGEKAKGSLSKIFGGGMKKAAIAAGAAFTAAGAAVGKMVKDVVGAYGRYEQLVGGVDTLFGNGGKSMEEYAAGMYKMNQKGKDVKALQEELIAAGYDIGKSGADGIFGPKTKAAFDAYAKAGGKMVKDAYENSGSAADTVIENAWSAFERAGMSANDYMDTVTSFSASLLQGLGGDSEKAAAYADRAVVDMSDNANKMGTDISSIQNAYQGFAKGNYTMLDNLKLGYGGTKTEMERLIKDASKMTDVQKELGIEVDSSSMSFDNIVNAISVMQKSMGISGTTQEEAAKTIEGSLASTKAAWQNLLTAMGSGKNVKKAMSGFVKSARNVVHNVMPIVKNALSGIAEFITEIAPIIIAEIPGLVRDVLPGLIQAAGSIVKAIAQALPGLMGAVFDTLTSLDWADIGSTIVGALGSIGSGIVGLFKSAKEKAKNVKWTELGSQLWTDFKTGVGDLVTNLKTWFDEAKAKIAGINWVATGKVIWAGIKLGIGNLFNAFQTLFSDGEQGAQSIDWVGLGNAIWGLILQGLTAITTLLRTLFDAGIADVKSINWSQLGTDIWDWIKTGLKGLVSGFSGLFEEGKGEAETKPDWVGLGNSIWGFILEGLSAITSMLTTLFDAAIADANEIDWVQVGKDIWNAVVRGISGLASAIWGMFDGAHTDAQGIDWTDVGNSITSGINTALNALKGILEGMLAAITGDDDALSKLSGTVQAMVPWVLGLAAAFVTYKAAMAISSVIDGVRNSTILLTAAQAALNFVMNLNPFVLIASLIAGVAAALITAYQTNDEFREKVNKAWGAVKRTATVLWSKLQGFFDWISENWEKLTDWLKQPFEEFEEWYEGSTFKAIVDKVVEVYDKLKSLSNGRNADAEGGVGSLTSGGLATGTVGASEPGVGAEVPVEPTVETNAIQAAIDEATASGKTTVTIEGVEFSTDYTAEEIADALGIKAGVQTALAEPFDVGLDPDTNEAIRDINDALAREHFKIKVKAEVQGGIAEGSGNHWARGMSGGRILKGATIFGMDGAGRPQIGGEAGAEAVVGVNSLGAMIRDSVRSSMGGVMGSMAAILSQMQSNNGMVMQLDSGTLVGALVRDIDAGLGDLSLYRNGVRA